MHERSEEGVVDEMVAYNFGVQVAKRSSITSSRMF